MTLTLDYLNDYLKKNSNKRLGARLSGYFLNLGVIGLGYLGIALQYVCSLGLLALNWLRKIACGNSKTLVKPLNFARYLILIISRELYIRVI